jgi:hypothetical protein
MPRIDDSSAAKLFEEIKILVGDIPRISTKLDRLLSSTNVINIVASPSDNRMRITPGKKTARRVVPTMLHEIVISGEKHTLKLLPSWTRELKRLGWPDDEKAIEVLRDIEAWFSEDPARLRRRGKFEVGEISFEVRPTSNETTTLAQFARK